MEGNIESFIPPLHPSNLPTPHKPSQLQTHIVKNSSNQGHLQLLPKKKATFLPWLTAVAAEG